MKSGENETGEAARHDSQIFNRSGLIAVNIFWASHLRYQVA